MYASQDGVSGAPIRRPAKSTGAWHKRLDTISASYRQSFTWRRNLSLLSRRRQTPQETC